MINFTKEKPDSSLFVDFKGFKKYLSLHSKQYVLFDEYGSYGETYIVLSPEPRKVILNFQNGIFLDEADFNWDEFVEMGKKFDYGLRVCEPMEIEPIMQKLRLVMDSMEENL